MMQGIGPNSGSNFSRSALFDPALMDGKAPDHVDSVLWNLSTPEERVALLAKAAPGVTQSSSDWDDDIIVVGGVPQRNNQPLLPSDPFWPFSWSPDMTIYEPTGGGATDATEISPDPKIDLSDVTKKTYNFPAGPVNFMFDNKTLPAGSEGRIQAEAILSNLLEKFDSLNQPAQAAVMSLHNVVFSDLPVRSFTEETRSTFYFDSSEFTQSSINFATSNIIHDGNHDLIYAQTGSLDQSRGTAAEVSGWQLQLDNASALLLTQAEQNYLAGLIANPASQDPRVNQPPY